MYERGSGFFFSPMKVQKVRPGRLVKNDQKHVLVLLGWYDHRVHRSIEVYARQNHWRLHTNFARERSIPWGWKGDGILAWLGAGDDLAEFVAQAALPTVDFSLRRPHLKLPRVLEDNERIGELAAEYFLSRGFNNFAFYSNSDNWAYAERGRKFIAALDCAGRSCTWLRQPYSSGDADSKGRWQRKRELLSKFLDELPKPIAVLAANDDHAIEVFEACELRGIRVPDEVAILGVGNNLLAPDSRIVPISSVETNLGALGRSGAELLDRLMKGEPPPRRPIRVPPLGVIERQSSDFFALDHSGLVAGLRFIHSYSHEWINIDDVAHSARMSRRALHKAFVQKLGNPPGEVLRIARIERAKRLLVDSNHKVETVAKLCGYQSAASFGAAFLRLTSMMPTQFRNAVCRWDG